MSAQNRVIQPVSQEERRIITKMLKLKNAFQSIVFMLQNAQDDLEEIVTAIHELSKRNVELQQRLQEKEGAQNE